MGPPPSMRSVVERNVVMRRKIVFNERPSALEYGSDVTPTFSAVVTPCSRVNTGVTTPTTSL
jgi:hypothetical protein